MQALRRERLVFRREVAARVAWQKGGNRRVEVLGAREVIPIARRGVGTVDDNELGDLAFDPTELWLLRLAIGDDDEGESDLLHPLADNSELHYRFRSGETTTIRLADGRSIRLLELQVLPRRSEPTLLSGSLWLEAETYAAVRGVFSLAAPARMSLRPGGGFITLPLPEASFSLRYLTVEYALWQGEWWLPRLLAMEGSATVGGLEASLIFEQLYDDYEVFGSADSWPGFAPIDTMVHSIVARSCRPENDD
jgi:hypothetical protein